MFPRIRLSFSQHVKRCSVLLFKCVVTAHAVTVPRRRIGTRSWGWGAASALGRGEAAPRDCGVRSATTLQLAGREAALASHVTSGQERGARSFKGRLRGEPSWAFDSPDRTPVKSNIPDAARAITENTRRNARPGEAGAPRGAAGRGSAAPPCWAPAQLREVEGHACGRLTATLIYFYSFIFRRGHPWWTSQIARTLSAHNPLFVIFYAYGTWASQVVPHPGPPSKH